MSDKDIAIEKALSELKRIQKTPGGTNLFQENTPEGSTKVCVTEEFASEIASELATKISNTRIKQVLLASAASLIKSGQSIDSVWDIDGMSEYVTLEELVALRKAIL